MNAERPGSGPFRAGERVQLTDPKGRLHTVTLEPGKQFHTHRGAIEHDALIGAPGGQRGRARRPAPQYLALRPLLDRLRAVDAARRGGDLSEGRGPDRHDGRHPSRARPVLEAGAGSGSLTCSLLRAVGPSGRVHLLRDARRPRRGRRAQRRRRSSASARATGTCALADVAEHPGRGAGATGSCWTCSARGRRCPQSAAALQPGGVLIGYVATTTQLSRLVEAAARRRRLHRAGRLGDACMRSWHVRGPGGAPRAPDDRAHRVPGDGAAARAGRHRAGAPAPRHR